MSFSEVAMVVNNEPLPPPKPVTPPVVNHIETPILEVTIIKKCKKLMLKRICQLSRCRC